MNKKTETYLFFGSFNPIHKGHISLIEHILKNTTGEIYIIVSPQNPHKSPKDLAPFEDRYNMVRIAMDDLISEVPEYADRINVSDIENHLPLPSYTVNTLYRIKELYPQKSLCLLTGSDIIDTIHTWYRYDEIIRLVSIKHYPRREEDRSKCSDELKDAPVIDCSSTEFRKTHRNDILTEAVAEYINNRKLY